MNKNVNCPTVPRPSFLGGFARVVDLGCTLQRYNTAANPELENILSMQSDWDAVGDDLKKSYDQQVENVPA